jgi:gamma-glutamyltranspeptidase/glutathione hydrolase
VQPDLARTLRIIADCGPDAFYCGPIADQIVAEMRAGGGLITKDDLAAYRANVRRPIHGTYRGHDIFAPPPPSSGGIALVEMLNVLENFDLAGPGHQSAATIHLFTEAMRRAYFDRAKRLGDPAFTDVPVARLTSKAYARELAAEISATNRATPSEKLGKDVLASAEGENTTHFSIVDSEGNAVANTYTLQDSYGSYVVVRGAGFLLNNEMTDFNLQPGVTDRRGRIGTPPNIVAPHKRMLSSQTPTIVLRDGQVLLVTGTPGGRTIINTVLGVVTNVIDFKMPIREAVDAPRMHHQWMPDVLRIEPGRATDDARRELESMGHKIESIGRQGDAHSIWIDPTTGLRHGAADRRLSGKAAGY